MIHFLVTFGRWGLGFVCGWCFALSFGPWTVLIAVPLALFLVCTALWFCGVQGAVFALFGGDTPTLVRPVPTWLLRIAPWLRQETES